MGRIDDGRPVCPPQHQRHHEQAPNTNQYGSITTEDGFYMSPASSTTALSVPVPTGAGSEGAAAQQPHWRHESVGAAGSVATEQDSLLGERLVATDNEEETPENSTNDLATLGMLDAGRRRRGQSSTPSSMPSSKFFTRAFGDRLLNLNIRRPGARITRFMMLTGIAVCIFIMAWVFFSPSTENPVGGTEGGASIPGSHHPVPVPFPNVDRAAFGDPASCIVDRNLFDPSLLHPRSNRKHSPIETASSSTAERSGGNISSSGPFLKVPFPTGAFWTNLVLPPTANLNTSFPIVTYPFAFTWSPSTLQVSYPALRRRMDVISVRDTFEPDVTFGLAEEVLQRHITRFDPLSVTLRFHTTSSQAYAETYLVQGSPYVTFKYGSVTPVLTALSTFRDVVCPRDDAGNIREASSWDEVRDPSQQRPQSQQDGVNKSEESTSKAADRSDKQGRRRRWMSQTERRTKWGVCTITSGGKSNDGTSVTTTVLHGVQFLLQTAENLTWMVFASEPIAFSFDKVSRRSVTSVGKYTGVLRLALIPPVIENSGKTTNSGEPTTEEPLAHDNVPLATSSGVRRLIYHSGVYPVGGEVTWAYRPAVGAPIFPLSNRKSIVADNGSAGTSVGNTELGDAQDKMATIKFQYRTRTMTDDSNSNPNALRDDLLLLALPHHVHSLPPNTLLNSDHFDVVYQCIKGAMTPVVGDTWFLDENLTSTGFDAVGVPTSLASGSNKNEQGVDARVRDVILENVEKDLKGVLPTKEENVYGFGKQVARVAQLAHIASRMSSLTTRKKTRHDGEHDDHSINIAKNAAKALHKYLSELLDNERKDLLLFDQNLGGIVTKDGLVDSEADFGNGRYNDHHFHYGYILYACAVMGKLNSTFVAEYGRHVDALLFDVAYSKNSNSEIGVEGAFFPMARHKSWFDGHSFASGLFTTATGKSQESSSEAVNCYYGAYLWSIVRWGNVGEGDEAALRRVDFAKLLLATEIRGAKTYWHMTPPGSKVEGRASAASPVYNPILSKNYMIGVVGMLDATCSTWFGSSNLYVHMINFLPVTAITAELFDKPYVQVEFSEVMQPMLPNVEPAWRGYVICDHAILDPAAAWNEALELESYELDAAISKSQILYWISTRPDFVMPRQNFPVPSPITPVENTSKQPSLMSHLCEKHPACSKLGLIGSCCPTLDGIYLGCCGQN